MTYSDEMRWTDALADFDEARAHLSASTRRLQLKNLRRFARAVDKSPWHVTAGDYEAWIEAQQVATATRYALRSSLRAFFRWAVSAGRMIEDPTAHGARHVLALPVPELWEQPLTAWVRYLYAKGAAPSTVRSYRDELRMFAREHATLDPFAVTLDDLYEWMAGKRWGRETRRRRKVSVSSFYQWAVSTERMAEDPTRNLPTVRGGDPVARPVTDAELAAALSASGDERWTLALRLAAELGLRRGEVARVHTADVVRSDDGGWLTVHGKGGKVRRVPLTDALALILSIRPAGYVFPGQVRERQAHAAGAGHISARYLGKKIAELLPAGVTMHALRHRFATRAYSVDRDVFTVQRLLGHASPATTQRYVQVADSRLRALVEAVGQ